MPNKLVVKKKSKKGEGVKKTQKKKESKDKKSKDKKTKDKKSLASPLKTGCMSPIEKIPDNLIKTYAPDSEAFNKLWDLEPDEPGKIKMFGKTIIVPRWHRSYIRDYEFTGVTNKAEFEVPEILKPFYEYAQNTKFAKDKDGPFNQILVNGYANGLDYISAHSDDEPELKPESCIMSISLGETRTFRITGKKDKNKIEDFSLNHGDVVIMMGEMQELYKHQIVKVGGEKGSKMGRRINITLRKFK